MTSTTTSKQTSKRSTGYVTVLTNPRDKDGAPVLLTKTYTSNEEGGVDKTAYGDALYFDVCGRECSNLHDLHTLLLDLEDNPRACIVRAHRRPHTRTRKVWRRSKGKYATFDDVPTSWALVDVDTCERPEHVEEGNLEQAAVYLRSRLPKPFQRAGCVARWSSSAGVDGWDVLKVHLWFWLKSPATSAELKVYTQNHAKGLFDAAPFHPAQIHYTAAPIFDGLASPIATRTILLDGKPADLKAELEKERRAVRQREALEDARLNRPRFNGYSTPPKWKKADRKPPAERALERCTREIENAGKGQRHTTATSEIGRVKWWVDRGKLTEHQIRSEARQAWGTHADCKQSEVDSILDYIFKGGR